MLAVAIANESAARVHRMMFAASRCRVIVVVALMTAISSCGYDLAQEKSPAPQAGISTLNDSPDMCIYMFIC